MKKLNLRKILEILKTQQPVHISRYNDTYTIALDSDPQSILWSFDTCYEAIEFCESVGFNMSTID